MDTPKFKLHYSVEVVDKLSGEVKRWNNWIFCDSLQDLRMQLAVIDNNESYELLKVEKYYEEKN